MELALYPVISAIKLSSKGKAIQLQAWIGFTGSRRLRLLDFKKSAHEGGQP
jgi:hypothetical protein